MNAGLAWSKKTKPFLRHVLVGKVVAAVALRGLLLWAVDGRLFGSSKKRSHFDSKGFLPKPDLGSVLRESVHALQKESTVLGGGNGWKPLKTWEKQNRALL